MVPIILVETSPKNGWVCGFPAHTHPFFAAMYPGQEEMIVGCLKLQIQLPGCSSLKEKRGRIKPVLHRMRKTFNVSAAETNHNDVWQSAEISVVTVSGDNGHIQRRLEKIITWIEENQPDLVLVDDRIEVITGWN